MKTRIDSDRQRRQNMNWDKAGNNLDEFKSRVQERWQQLSDRQISTISGRRDELSRELQQTYGLSENEAETQIQDFESGETTVAGASSGRGSTERTREFGTGNDQGGGPHSDKHGLH